MPGKKTPKPKSSAGESGLSTETTSGGQAPGQNMNPGESSVAAVALPRQETPEEIQDAALKAFDDLYGTYDGLPEQNPHYEAIDVDKDNEDKDNEEEDVFLLPESQNFAPGTAEYFTEKLRFNGLRWRHEVKQRVKKERPYPQRFPPMGQQSSLTNGRGITPTRANAA